MDFVVDGAKRMQGMIDGLLEYSRVDTDGDPMEPTPVGEVVSDVRDDLAVRIDDADATLTVDSLPTLDTAAETAGVDPGSLFLPTYATGSMAGSVSMGARAAELAVFRLSELGYPPTEIMTATGRAPVAPVSYNESVAMARTNDALAYGGEVYLQVREESTVFEEVPSNAREEYGVPFEEIFEEAGWDFYELPESVFAPAKVTIDVVDGDTYVVGETDEELLAESFGLQ